MKLKHVLAISISTFLLFGCSVKEENQKDTQQVSSSSEEAMDIIEEENAAVATKEENILDEPVYEYILNKREDIQLFVRDLEFPNTKDFNINTVTNAEVTAHPIDSAFENSLDVQFDFYHTDPSIGSITFSVNNSRKRGLSYEQEAVFSKETVNGIDYYIEKSDTSRVGWFKNDFVYELYSPEGVTEEELIEIAQTLEKNEELSNILYFEEKELHRINNIYNNNLYQTTFSYINGLSEQVKSFIIKNEFVTIMQSTNDPFYYYALDYLEEGNDNFEEVAISPDLKGIVDKSEVKLYIKVGENFFTLSADTINHEITIDVLVEMAQEL